MVMLRFPLLPVFFFKQKTAYEMRISDWSSDVCSSDLLAAMTCISGPPCKPGKTALLIFAPISSSLLRIMPPLGPRSVLCEIGRASCRERGGQYVYVWVVDVSLKKKISEKSMTTIVILVEYGDVVTETVKIDRTV